MSQDPRTRNLSRACWRCQYWGGLVADVHARCTRLNSKLQADPVTGCVHWAPGAGDRLCAGSAPIGFDLLKHDGIWGPPASVDSRRSHPMDDRPRDGSCDDATWDQQWAAKAWRETDALMARAQHCLGVTTHWGSPPKNSAPCVGRTSNFNYSCCRSGGAMEEEEKAASLDFDSSDGQRISFACEGDARAYAVREREKWEWLIPLVQSRPHNSPLYVLREIYRSIDNALALPSVVDGGDGAAAEFHSQLSGYFSWSPAIHDRAPLQGFILKVADRSTEEGAWTLAWLLIRAQKTAIGPNFSPWGEIGALPGLVTAWHWSDRELANEAGAIAAGQVQSAARDVYAIKDQALAVMNTANSATAVINAQAAAGGEAVKESSERLRKFSSELEQSLDEVVMTRSRELNDRWNELTTTYEEALKLKAPAKYWRIKAQRHTKLSIGFGVASVIFGLGVGALLMYLYYWLMGDSAGTTLPPWGHLLPGIVAAVVFLWVLRTLMRMTMSHVHLSLDAAEREIMVQCYLAMTKKGEATGEERGALFAAIFRPTGDGIVKDETPPIPLWEMLKAAKPKPGGGE